MRRAEPIVVNGASHWRCPTCDRVLPPSSFYSKPHRWNGLTVQCRECHMEGSIRTRDKDNARIANREHMRRARARNPEKYRERERLASRKRPVDEKVRARRKVNSAVRRGKLARPNSCSRCGATGKVTGHHRDYSKPLDVTWLCYVCHAEVDAHG